MRLSNLLTSLLFLVAVPLHAKLIRIEPPAPTSETAIQVVIAGNNPNGCAIGLERIDRQGSQITLRYRTGVCILTPMWWSDRVDLGPLLTGTYTVAVEMDGQPLDSYSLFVADAHSPLRILPSSKVSGAIEAVQITSMADLNLCDASGCVKPTVIFGGIVVPDQFVTVVDSHTVVASTMPHDPGRVDVTVKTLTQTITAASAFLFRSRNQNEAPNPALFERILLPIVYNGFGAFETFWRTDVNILNTNPVPFGPLDAARTFYFTNCATQPPCPGYIPAGGNVSAFDALTKASAGLVLMPQRDLAPGLRFGYRMWELNQFAQGLSSGTELPVVREKDLHTGKLDLVSVPLDHRSRIALRIYGPDSEAIVAQVRVYAVGDAKPPLAQANVLLKAPACMTDPCDAAIPSFGMIADLEQAFPQIAQFDRVRVEVEPTGPFRFWAFASITNNATQHVTLVMPQ